jgi:hypothetical protein
VADQLASAADLASLLKQSFDEYDTATAVLVLEACTAVVQAAAGQRIVRATTTEGVVWGGSDSVLTLPERPVVSVAAVTYGGSALTEGTASGTWRLTRDGIWRDLGWSEVYGEPSSVLVTWTHGYLASEQGIQLGRGVTLGLARGLFTNPDGVVREQIDDYAVAYAEASSALEAQTSVMALLRKQYGRKAGMVRIV